MPLNSVASFRFGTEYLHVSKLSNHRVGTIQVRRRGDDAKFEAIVEAVGNECDLAILRIFAEDEAAFFDGLIELSFGPLPELQDQVVSVASLQYSSGLNIYDV